MIEINNEMYAAVQALGKDVVIELARGVVRARMLHPVFAESAPAGAAVVYAEACELVGSVYDGEPVARQRAEAVDTAVTAIRYMGKFGVERPAGATESLKVAYDSDDDFEGVREAPATLYEMLEQTAREACEPRGSVLQQAIDIINGERQDVYGSPEDSFAKIAGYWTTYLGDQMTDRITAEDVALMMTLFKIAREANQHKRDNIIDAAGYLGIYADMQEE